MFNDVTADTVYCSGIYLLDGSRSCVHDKESCTTNESYSYFQKIFYHSLTYLLGYVH